MSYDDLFYGCIDAAAEEGLCYVSHPPVDVPTFCFEYNMGDFYVLQQPWMIMKLIMFIRQYVFENGGDEYDIKNALNLMHHSARRNVLSGPPNKYVFWFHGEPNEGEVSLTLWLKEQGHEVPALTLEDVRLS